MSECIRHADCWQRAITLNKEPVLFAPCCIHVSWCADCSDCELCKVNYGSKKEGKTMKEVKACLLVIGSLLLLAALSSCSPLEKAISQSNGNLTPEQIQAYDAAGMSVVACLSIQGPPPAGAGSIVVVPKTVKGSLTVNVDCHQQGQIELQGVTK